MTVKKVALLILITACGELIEIDLANGCTLRTFDRFI